MGKIIILNALRPVIIFPEILNKWPKERRCMEAIVEFRTLDYIDTYTCYADMGIGIVLKRKNKKKLKIDIKDFSKLKFYDYLKNFKEYMNIVKYWE